MTTYFQRLLAAACTVILFIGYNTAWSGTLTGGMNDYLYCAKDDSKQDADKGDKKGKGGKKGKGEGEEEPDCEE